MIDRRSVVQGLAASAVLAPVPARGQKAGKAYRVGLLMTTTPAAADHIVSAFAEALRARGRTEGSGLTLEYRWADGKPERLAELAADLVRSRVDVLVASSQAAALAAQRATATIPIVMVNAADPVEAGLVASLARPGGNVTGLSQQLTPEIRAKQLQLLKELVPRVTRVAVLRGPTTAHGLEAYEAAARSLKLRVNVVEVAGGDDLERAFAAMAGGVHAILVPGDAMLFTERQRVAALARQHRLPGVYSVREFTEAGGLMSYSARLTEQFRRAADYVDRILLGASPSTLPVESPAAYELVVNIATARALGVAVPQSILLRADAVIP